MIVKYILILIISGQSTGGRTTVIQEFNSLNQCQYVYKALTEQIVKNRTSSAVAAGGCFEK